MGIHLLQMRIGYDIRPFLKEETGVGVYFRNLLFSLAKIDRTNEYFLFSSSLKDRFNPKKIPPLEKKHFREFFYPVKIVNFFWQRLGWPPMDYFFNKRLDLTHSPTPLPLPTKGKKIITVYDIFFLDFPDLADDEARRSFTQRMKGAMEKADGIVTISRFTAQRLTERFGVEGKKIRIAYPGINRSNWENVEIKSLERTKADYGLPSDFLLFVGASERRKNLLNLLAALKIIHRTGRQRPQKHPNENSRTRTGSLGKDDRISG
jgi:glycosyltransferase involved in cell wall biosynthesis